MDYAEALRRWSEEAMKPLEGELEKTPEEVKMINLANFLIDAELKSLEIEGYKPASPEKVHFLSRDIFIKNFPTLEHKGFFRSTEGAVYINKDSTNTKARLFSCLLHELIHRASEIKFYVDNEGGVYDARAGYRVFSAWKKPERQNRLSGFNELMTDHTVYKILFKNQQFLETEIGITKEDIQGPIYTYMHYGPILISIMDKVSKDKGIPLSVLFNDFERGQFEPNILILKNVERSFGKGALGVLSLLGTLEDRGNNDKLEEMVKNFFAEKDKSRRQVLGEKIKEFVDKVPKGL